MCLWMKHNHIYIAMSKYNLLEYCYNYSDTPGSLWQFKRREAEGDNVHLIVNNSQSFKNEAALEGRTANSVNITKSSVKTQK